MTTTLTNVRCGGCGASLSPVVPDSWQAGDTVVVDCTCGHHNEVTSARRTRDALGAALTECSAAFAGVSSMARARDVIEVLRSGRVQVDEQTRAKLAEIMGIRE